LQNKECRKGIPVNKLECAERVCGKKLYVLLYFQEREENEDYMSVRRGEDMTGPTLGTVTPK